MALLQDFAIAATSKVKGQRPKRYAANKKRRHEVLLYK